MKGAERDEIELRAMHTPAAIRDRLHSGRKHSYLRDFVYGGVDGAITTFAVVSGVAGAGLSSGIIVVLGAANLVADGFSMAVGNYLATRAEAERTERLREIEREHIHAYPEGEREEIRQIFADKGFQGDSLERIVSVVSADRERWIDTMIQEEYGLSLAQRCPWRAAATTFGAFAGLGSLPLLTFLQNLLWPGSNSNPYFISGLLTAVSLFLVGAAKARFIARPWYRCGMETLLIGGSAAGLAYIVGAALGSFQPQ